MSSSRKDRVYDQICSAIKENQTFFLSGHKKPDGDTVASELAFASLLKRLKKKAEIYNLETVPISLDFLPGVGQIRTAKKVQKNYDVAVIFECCDSRRMGNIIDLDEQAKIVINIDHHLKHSFFGHINLIDVKASSNSEQLFSLFERLKLPLTKEEAVCLYTGIIADTGRFQHSNTNAETLRIASKLVECGVEVHPISEKMFGTRTFSGLKLLGIALERLQLIENRRIAYTIITNDDYLKSGSTEEDTEEIVNYGLQIPDALMSILIRENKDRKMIKASFRSRGSVNVCRLAQKFGGGGHKRASGCELKGPIQKAAELILSQAREFV